MTTPRSNHPSDSNEQCMAERAMLVATEQVLGVRLSDKLEVSPSVNLDGFCNGSPPICVEAWAHQGKPKGSQPAKVMKDMCKMLLVERLLGQQCRKILVVCDEVAISFLRGSRWQARFASEFGFEVLVVSILDELRQSVRDAQNRQFR